MKYRTEQLWGEGYRDAAKVMAHEVFELRNTDIIKTLSETILKDTEMSHLLRVLGEEIENDCIFIGDNGLLYDIVKNYSNDDKYKTLGSTFFEEVLHTIKEETGKDIKYCLWLCDSPQDIINSYDINHELNENSFDCYEESDVILSDLGVEGKLYGYVSIPVPINGG